MIILEQADFEKQIALVIAALSDAGYDPYAQLTGFIQTGDDTFITRRNDARAIVSSLDREMVARYVSEKMKQTT